MDRQIDREGRGERERAREKKRERKREKERDTNMQRKTTGKCLLKSPRSEGTFSPIASRGWLIIYAVLLLSHVMLLLLCLADD